MSPTVTEKRPFTFKTPPPKEPCHTWKVTTHRGEHLRVRVCDGKTHPVSSPQVDGFHSPASCKAEGHVSCVICEALAEGP